MCSGPVPGHPSLGGWEGASAPSPSPAAKRICPSDARLRLGHRSRWDTAAAPGALDWMV